ncbi:hypothetical protein BEP19_08195 [Ammoniphilus oxalaticus]|uniref:histidine kinase n=1 Tax=Ammoniphilus oxalaticus TaxID=66863 RepID=A0A419SK68_9BACL|nr:PAS domain S-box protein [Ammoniphilus oxalaticus]RKD24365.1 hypothetical protein BEP19_08195 [Ammoniphilus oxalaticus]
MLQQIFVNFSVFSFLVSAAVVTRIFYFPIKPIKHAWILGGVYAGLISLILMNLSIPYNETLSLDIRYIPFIISCAYFGLKSGLLTAALLLIGEWLFSENLAVDLSIFMIAVPLFFVSLSFWKKPYQRALILLLEYVTLVFTAHWLYRGGAPVPFSFMMILTGFLLMGLTISIWLIEGYSTLYSLINEYTKLNTKLKKSQQELRETLRGQQGVIFKFKKEDGNFIHTLCDGQLIRKSQLNPDLFLSPDWTRLLQPDIVDELLGQYERAWQGSDTSSEIRWPNGHFLQLMLQPIFRSGQVIEVVGSIFDITEKKRMEQALEESERHYRLIAENTSDLITVLQVNGKAKYCSPSHQVILGYSPDDLLDGEIKSIFEPQVLYRIREKLAKIIREQQPDQIEFRCQHKNGNWVQFESRCMPVTGPRGDVEYIVIVSRDISERKKAEELALASEKLSVVGELAAGVAHEIRNPLTTLKGFIQMFQKGEIDPVYLDVISSELDRIELITNEFLILAKPQVVHYRVESLVSIIENVVAILTPQMKLNNIQVYTEFEQQLPQIKCEPSQLKQLFVNIMKNAIEAMPTGGIMKLKIYRQEDYLLAEVEDNGCGIPGEIISRLGEPFYTLKEKGTGLGLMVCKKIINEHGGTIQFFSELGEGATVQIALPLFNQAE